MAVYLIDYDIKRSSADQIASTINEARRKAIQNLQRTGNPSVRIYVAGRRTGDYAGDVALMGCYVWISHRRGESEKKYEIKKDGSLGRRL